MGLRGTVEDFLRTAERALARGRVGLAMHRLNRAREEITLAEARARAPRKVRMMPLRVPRVLIERMHADYQTPMSLAAVGRKYGRSGVRELFLSRGLPVREAATMPKSGRRPNGQMEKLRPKTPGELDALVARAKRIVVPRELRAEWRHWPLERRAAFIARIRAKLGSPHDRPKLPFSSNVTPFDYGTPAAHALARQLNAGLESRHWRLHLKVSSQGVIWGGQLWFWTSKAGYVHGPYVPGRGRPCLHWAIWEKHQGRPVPPGCVVRFIDRNPNNLAPENLALATRNDLARENQAAALTRKARELTALLLQRAQHHHSNNGDTDGHTDTFAQLQQAG